jgi:hypothetical protein
MLLLKSETQGARRGGDGVHRLSACGFALFAEDAAEGFFELRCFALDVLAEGFAGSYVKRRLVAGCFAGGVGFLGEVVDEIFVEADGDASFALWLRFWWSDAPALSLAEIVLAFHWLSSYCHHSQSH